MRTTPFFQIAAGAAAIAFFGLGGADARSRRDDEEKERVAPSPGRMAPARMMRFEFSDSLMGATPGGAQDISSARDRILAGEVPHPNTFTPEGLFSEHDLPLPAERPCDKLLCLSGASTQVELLAQPEARTLAQLGFSSNLDGRTWRRERMNLVAVIDKSGSMSGQPLATVKASLHQLVDQLGAGDQLAVVLYGDRSHVHLPPTPIGAQAAQVEKDRARVHAAIDQIQSAGSTAMEAGLRLGYDVAAQGAGHFQGRTRVMLFTDERPNVGATGKESFMGMAREASRRGIGLTTIGVGVHFGAELATAVSSVRGGNLFFFPDVPSMKEKFRKDLDTMLTELAYDMRLVVRPGSGHRVVGVYGLPGDLIKRTPDGGLEMTVETIFLSRERGGIYFSFAPDGGGNGALPPPPGPVGRAEVRYTGLDGKVYSDALPFMPVTGVLPLGLRRGKLLVDEVTALKRATELHLQKNDQEGAYRLVRALRLRFERAQEAGLQKELQMIVKLDETLTRLSGHKGEPAQAAVARDTVSGLPR